MRKLCIVHILQNKSKNVLVHITDTSSDNHFVHKISSGLRKGVSKFMQVVTYVEHNLGFVDFHVVLEAMA